MQQESAAGPASSPLEMSRPGDPAKQEAARIADTDASGAGHAAALSRAPIGISRVPLSGRGVIPRPQHPGLSMNNTATRGHRQSRRFPEWDDADEGAQCLIELFTF